VTPVSSCSVCGGQLPDGALFCPACGNVVLPKPAESEPESGPPAEPPFFPRFAVPPWATADWSLAVLAGFLFVVLLGAAGSLYGMVLAVTAHGLHGAGFGALAGPFLGIAAFGGDTVVSVHNGADGIFFSLSGGLVPTLLVAPAVLGAAVLRFALKRVTAGGPAAVRAFAVKFALVAGIGLGIAGAVAGTGPGETPISGGGFGLVADVGAGEAGFWAVLGLLGVGAFVLRRRGLRLLGAAVPEEWAHHRPRVWVRTALLGAAAYGGLAAVLGVGLVAAAAVNGNSVRERILAVEAAPALLGNVGVAGAAVAGGASVRAHGPLPSNIPGLPAPALQGHLSLLHFGFPPGPNAGTAPVFLFLALALAPLAVAGATRLALDRARPEGERDALRVGYTVTAGFALAAWFAAAAAPLDAAGGAFGPDTDLPIVRAVAARPSVGAVLALAVLWGLIGSLATAMAWVARHRPAPPAEGPLEAA